MITQDDILIADGTGGMLGGRGSIAADNSVDLAAGGFQIDASGNVRCISLKTASDLNQFLADGSGMLAGGPISWNTLGDFDALSLTINGGSASVNADGSVDFAAAAFRVDATGNCIATSFAGDGSGLTNVPATNPFNQSLDTADTVNFQDVNIVGVGSLFNFITAINNSVALLQSQLSPGVSGSLTPGTGTIDTTNGVVTNIT